MHDEQAQLICDMVRAVSEAPGHQLQDNPLELRDFEPLVQTVSKNVELQRRQGNAPHELEMVAAMGWLGPRTGFPPSDMRADLFERFRQVNQQRWKTEARRKCILGLVTAYGCGWARNINSPTEGWNGQWEGARVALTRVIAHSVQDAYNQLEEQQVGIEFPEPSYDAAILAIRLLKPLSHIDVDPDKALRIESGEINSRITIAGRVETDLPPGSKAVYTYKGARRGALISKDGRPPIPLLSGAKIVVESRDGGTRPKVSFNNGLKARELPLKPGQSAVIEGPASFEVWECTCGWKHCHQKHRLAAWSPEGPTRFLTNFIASAVKGPQLRIRANSFLQQSMLGALWAREGFTGRLRIAERWYRVCRECGDEYLEGDRHCRTGHPVTPTTERKTEGGLITDGTSVPLWKQQEGWRCSSCNKLYIAPLEKVAMKKLMRCGNCGHHLFIEGEMMKIFEKKATLLGRVRELNKKRSGHDCPKCKHELTELCWCPYRAIEKHPPGGHLDGSRITWGYVRTWVEMLDENNPELSVSGADENVEFAAPHRRPGAR
ncbi:MAG: hypothetical protein ABFS45_17450 [Pseudomonadota bacterium]